MKWLRVAILVCVVAVLQGGLVNLISVTSLNIKPDLLLVLMVFFAVSSRTSDSIVISFVIGLASDVIATGLPMGPRTISFGLAGTLLANLHSVLAVKRIFHQAAAVFFCGLFAGLLAHFLTSVVSHQTMAQPYIVIFGTSLYSSLVAPFLFLPAVWLMRMKTDRLGRY